jgi:uncharacterized coiled-coil protein SlyX
MRRSRSGTLSLGFLCTLGVPYRKNAAWAQTVPAAPSSGGVVTLNFNAAVLGTLEAQRRLGALEKKYSPREQQLQNLNDEIEALKNSVRKRSSFSVKRKTLRMTHRANRSRRFSRSLKRCSRSCKPSLNSTGTPLCWSEEPIPLR